jgi:hypothetical protein
MFNNDLQYGQKYEEKAIQYFINNGYELKEYIPNKKVLEYDFIISKDNKDYKIEVKCDRLASKTGNIAIEYECSNKPSGISTSQADYYIYYIVDKCKLLIETSKLKEMIKNN